ncbi:MAG: thermonuclease family protein, partial [Phycisphaerae bacterium]
MADKRTAIRWILICGLLISCGTLLVRSLLGSDGDAAEERPTRVEVKRVIDGQYLKVSPDDRLVYAGIRTPHENEPFHDEARMRNEELVLGQELRLRFDDVTRDEDGRLMAYAFIDDLMINDVLVREG